MAARHLDERGRAPGRCWRHVAAGDVLVAIRKSPAVTKFHTVHDTRPSTLSGQRERGSTALHLALRSLCGYQPAPDECYPSDMVRRQIEFDEDTDRILAELAREYQGDLGKALTDLVHAHASVATFVEQCEEAQRGALLAQRERAERGFAEGRFTSWEDVKRRNRL